MKIVNVGFLSVSDRFKANQGFTFWSETLTKKL